MCLAMPTRVLSIEADGRGLVELGGVQLTVSLEMLDEVKVDDYVIVHVGHAITRLDPVDAEATLALFRQLAESSPDA